MSLAEAISEANERTPRENVLLTTNAFSFFFDCVSTSLLIFLIIRRSPESMKPYRQMLLIAAFFDFYVLLVFWGTNIVTRVHETTYIQVFNGPVRFLPPAVQRVGLGWQWSVPNVECLILPLELWFRFHLVKRRVHPMPRQVYSRLAIIVLIAQLQQIPTLGALFVYSSVPADHEALDRHFRPIMNVIIEPSGPPAVSFVVIMQAIVALTAYALALSLGVASIRVVTEDGTTGISPKTRQLLRQFTWSLFIKTLVPLFSAALPFALNVLGYFYGAELPLIAPIGAFLLSWGPFINSCSTILLFGAYRRAVGEMFTGLVCCSNLTPVQSIWISGGRTPTK